MWSVVAMGLLKAPTPIAASAITEAIPLNSLPPAKSNRMHHGLRTGEEGLGIGMMILVGQGMWLASRSVRGWRQMEKSEWSKTWQPDLTLGPPGRPDSSAPGSGMKSDSSGRVHETYWRAECVPSHTDIPKKWEGALRVTDF